MELDPDYPNVHANRAVAYYFKQEYDKSWEDVHGVQKRNEEISPKFIEALKKASGREK